MPSVTQPSSDVKQSNNANPTILRIKRRKCDEHDALDALVIEGQGSSNRPVKRSRGTSANSEHGYHTTEFGQQASKGIFRFAETVPASVFASEASKKSLKERIANLASHPPRRPVGPSTSSPARDSSAGSPSRSAAIGSCSPGASRRLKHPLSSAPLSARASNTNLLQIQEKARRKARYRIVQEKRSKSAVDGRQAQLLHREVPPVVRSSSSASGIAPAENATEDDTFEFLEAATDSADDSDAAPSDPIAAKLKAFAATKHRSARNRSRTTKSGTASAGSPAHGLVGSIEEDDDMMANFVPMLQEYLSINRPTTPENQPQERINSDVSPPYPGFDNVPDLSSGDAADSDSEYVYDVYYRDTAPSGSMNIHGDAVDVSGLEGLQRIAALSGLQDDELLHGPGDGSDDSDPPNTDDEDSNEEDFYRNDYPEGDEDQSDSDSGASGDSDGASDDDAY